MISKKKFLKFPLLALLALGSVIAIPTIAQAQVQIDRVLFPTPGSTGRYLIANLEVPNQDTNLPAFGGRLRIYDVHIAKMFEVTYHECRTTQDRQWREIVWRYYRGGRGQGAYTISCDRANQVVREYGLMDRTETTPVTYYRARTSVEMPSLDITGDKVTSWLELVRNFRPEGMD